MQPPAGAGGEQASRPRVCRRLFADEPAEPGARDNMLNQINEQLNKDLDDACTKYNFDFRAEVPLEGDWVWQRISDDLQERRDPVGEETPAPAATPPSDTVPAGPPQQPQDPPAEPL